MSYKAELRVNLPNFSAVVPVRYEKLSNEEEKAKQSTYLKADSEKGEVVEKKFEVFNNRPFKIDVEGQGKFQDFQQGEMITDFVDRKKVLVGAESRTLYDEGGVKEFQLQESKKHELVEVEVETDRETTKVFEILDTRPLEAYPEYVFDYEYEVFSDKKKTKTREITYEHELLKIVEHLYKHKLLGLVEFKRSGYTYAGILKPIITDGYFTLVMGLTLSVKQYRHLSEVLLAKQAKPISKTIQRTLATLKV